MLQEKAISKKRGILAVIFSIMILLSFVVAFDAKPAQAAIGGDGTQGNPYTIGSAEDLALFASYINNGTMPWRAPGAYFKLTADIDLTTYLSPGNPGYNSGKGWVPIGTTSWWFSGHFDGDGHKITGLSINDTTLSNAGLFGYIGAGATVENLGLEGVNIHGGFNTGGIVGTLAGGKISTSYVTGSISGGTSVGGIAGTITTNGIVDQCYVTGSVGGTSAVGGIAGYIFPGTLTNCYTKCSVTASGDGVGGIVGNDAGTGTPSTINNCYATGTITAGQTTNDTSGGIMGKMQNSGVSLKNAVAINPKIIGGPTYDVGRITGIKNGTLGHNYAITDIKDKNDVTTSWTNKTHEPNVQDFRRPRPRFHIYGERLLGNG